MAIALYIHIQNEEGLVLDVEELPSVTDTILIGKNPRRRDNKEVQNILPDVTTVIFPMARITFIEVMPTGDEQDVLRTFRD